MEQKLKLYKYDNGELVSFPSKESQIEIGVFTYTAKRMGDAPTITATINYKECLDNLWTGKECVIFNDEFFYVKNIPTSSYSNTDSRYKHECTFVNERSKLNGVLFTDVVDDKASDGKPVSNSSKFSFNGNITEFVARLNASLRYAKLQTIENSLVYGYHVVIDEGTKAIENFNDTFNVSFEDKTISEAIQEIYNSYNIPYYFEGKTVHVGLIDEEHDLLSDIDGGFKYGVNNELISISKSNKNNKIINRITALGSSENIPYYYPNETEKGSVAVTEYGKGTIPSYVELFNPFLFAKRIGKEDKIHYLKGNASWSTGVTIYEGDDSLDFSSVSFDESVKVKCKREDGSVHPESNIKICFSIHVKDREDYFTIKPYIAIDNSAFGGGYEYSFNKDLVLESYLSNERGRIDLVAGDEKFNNVEIPVGTYQLWITYKVSHRYAKKTAVSSFIDKNVKVKVEVFNSYEKFWFLNDSTTRYNLEDFGLRLTGGVSPYNGMAFAQKVTIPYYPISQNLILPIYRSTQGEERFYNAYNATYKDENGNYYDFKNEYAEDSISEHIVKFDDIKPTIKGVEYNGRRIDKFVEFAYDKSDNDLKQVVEDKEEYQHPYFFAKLPPLGFNLFDHALETGEMTISMTSGHCAGCSFTIMVNDANKNTVQVDEDGNLKYDEGGYVLVGSVNGQGNQSPIDSQNDTTNNSVWIALKKDIDSFGTILPSSNIKPSSNDTFVITNILLPQEYIEAAEERLKNEAIKYMAENNSSKFSFSIKFSRIFLAENPTIFDKISENSRIAVNYNGSIYPLHVSSYSYKMSEGALLPEIDVSLTDSVVIATNAIESAVSEAKADVLTYVDRYATLEEATTIFIRKDKEDYSPSPMVYGRSLTVNESHKVGENLDVAKNATIGEKTTTKAIQVGEQASVGNYVEGVSGIVMKIDSDGSSYMELDRLKVRMKAYFDELEVQKVNTVGGKMIMSPAGSFTCGAVLTSEELLANGEEVDTTNGSFYRCFFNAVQDDEQIENKFIVGDFAFSQSFNLTGRSSNKMYWREVVGVSSTYVDLSYDKCALDSDIPSSGDIICQLGSKVKDRQNAIVMTTVDEYAPAITLHYGIDKFSLSGTEIIQYGVRDGKAFFNSYGDMFLGEKPVEGVSNAYMKYTTEGGLEIKGKLTVGSTYNDKELGELFDAQQESLEDFKVSVTKEFENIRNEMDGAIDTWFGEETPTLENKPASDWLTNTDKDSHLGDLYYSNDGKSYRFQYTETEGYYWATIEDSEVVKALELAQKALDTADGKRTIFIEQPIPPYQVGDLWAAGENQPLKRCIKSREDKAESFYESDWDLADNSQAYADAIKDELQKSIKSTEDSLEKTIEDAEKAAKDYTDEGKSALQKSIDELNDAKANVADVYTKALVYTKEEANNEITKAEADAIASAKQQADAAIKLSEETTKAYADGIVTEEEKERIKQAEENLEEAKAYAEKKADEAFNNANAEVEKFDYLKAALKESTEEEGGLIQTSLIKLGYTNEEGKHQVMSGTNGIADSSLIGGGIATWWGGEMHDLLDYYTWDNEWVAKGDVTIPSNIPSGLIRFDGTGYFAKGSIWWDETGNLHADPLSFFVGEDSVGALLASFQVVNDKDGKIDYLIPKAPFSTLTVGELRIKDENGRFVTLKFKDGVLLSDESFASEKSVSAKGVGQSGGSGSVSYDRLDTWEGYTSDKAGYVLSAALGWDLKTMIENIDLGDFDLTEYLKVDDANDTYATKESLNVVDAKFANYAKTDFVTSSLEGYVNEIEVSGNGNAITSVTKNDKKITFSKGEKFLTKHQTIHALTISGADGTTLLTYDPSSGVGEIMLEKYMIGLSNVEDKALSTWEGSKTITTLGAITTGEWKGTAIANKYLSNSKIAIAGNDVSLGGEITSDTLKGSLDIVTKSDEQTISGVKTFSSAIKANGGIEIPEGKTIKFGDGTISWDGTNNAFKFHNPVYSTSSISAKGIGTGGSGGGGGVDVDWNNFPSSIIPSNSTYDLGSNTKPWDRVFASYFGTDNKITYIAGKSITLNSELYFSNGIDHIDTDGNAYLNGIQAVSIEAESITLNGNNVATTGDIGVIQDALDNVVTKDGYQTISGKKDFTGGIDIYGQLNGYLSDGEYRSWYIGHEGNGIFTSLKVGSEAVALAKDIPSLEGYATEAFVTTQGYMSFTDVTGLIEAYAQDNINGKYLLVSGGTLYDANSELPLHIKGGSTGAYIGFKLSNNTDIGYIGVNDAKDLIFGSNKVLHAGNTSFSAALTTGTKIGTITIGGTATDLYAPVGSSADLSNYYTKEQINSYVSQEINIFSEENLGTAASKGVTTSVTNGSNDLITSGGVYTSINSLGSSIGGLNGEISTMKTLVNDHQGKWQSLTSSTGLASGYIKQLKADTIDLGGSAVATTDDLADYLPITGGTITINSYQGITIKRDASNAGGLLWFANNGGNLGAIGFNANKECYIDTGSAEHTLIHSGNIGDYALPLSGGQMGRSAGITWDNGYYDSDAVGSHLSVLADTTQDNSLATQTGYSYNAILNVGGGGIDSYRFQLASYATSDNFLFYRGYDANSNKWKNWEQIIHSGNIGDYALPLKNGGSISLTETLTAVNIKNWGVSILVNTSGGWSREYVVGNEGYDNANIRFGGYGSAGDNLMAYIGIGTQDHYSATLKVYPTYATILDNTIIHSGNIGSQSVNYANSADYATAAKYIRPTASLDNPYNYPTVKSVKDVLVSLMQVQDAGIGDNIVISSSVVGQWNDDSASTYYTSVYSVIKIGGGYGGSTYGQWLLSSYGDNRVGYVGRNENVWGNIHWLATLDDIYTKQQIDDMLDDIKGGASIGGAIASSIYPSTNSGAELGVNGSWWRNLYVDRAMYLKGTGSGISGLFINELITSSGYSTDLWLYNSDRLMLYGSNIKLNSNTEVLGSFSSTGSISAQGNITTSYGSFVGNLSGTATSAGYLNSLTSQDEISGISTMSSWYDWAKSSSNYYRYGLLLESPDHNYKMQLCHNIWNGFQIRANEGGAWGDWRTLAFTDSNVASADYATSAGNASTLGGYSLSSVTLGSLYRGYMTFSASVAADQYWYVKAVYDTAWRNEFNKFEVSADYGNNQGKLSIELGGYSQDAGSYIAKASRYNEHNVRGFKVVHEPVDGEWREVLYLKLAGGSGANVGIYSTMPTMSAKSGVVSEADVAHVSFTNVESSNIYTNYKINGQITYADKLSTARTIWGQSFDGSGDVSGDITTHDSLVIDAADYYNGGWVRGLVFKENGYDVAGLFANGWYQHVDYINIIASGGYDSTNGLRILSNGNVLIGTATDSGYKLYVNGNSCVNGSLTVSGGIKMPYNDGDSTALYTEGMSTILGYSPRVGSSTTKIVGTKVLVDSNLEVSGSLSVSGSTLASQSWVNSDSTPAILLGNLVNKNVGLTSGYINEFKADTINGGTPIHSGNIGSYAISKNGGAVTGTLSIGSTRLNVGSTTLHGDVSLEYGALTLTHGNIGSSYWSITNDGDATVRTLSYTSDITKKNIISDIRLSLGAMANAPLIKFTWVDGLDSRLHVGTIAQYWDACLPEVVSTTTNGTLSLGYGELGVVMGISLAKEMTDMLTRMDNTDSEVDKLKKRISELEKELENLKAE